MLCGNDSRHGPVARAFHWASAALFLFPVALGAWMAEIDYYDRWQPITIRVHRGAGIAALGTRRRATSLARLGHPPAPAPRPHRLGTPPVDGGAMVSVEGAGAVAGDRVSVLDVEGRRGPAGDGTEVPVLMGVSKETAERIYTMHKVCAYATLAAVGLHVAGAVKHALEGNPEVLRRML